MRIILKCLAPYLAVVPFCVLSQNAWAAMLIYHAQCLLWSGRHLPGLCQKTPSSGPRASVFLPGKACPERQRGELEAGDVGFIVDAAGCSQAENKPLEAKWGFLTEPGVLSGWNWKWLIGLSIPFACAGPLAFLLLPMMLKDITPIQWLQDYGVTRATTIPLILYFGVIHPPLEQAHWSRLRQATPWAHLAFAGYHGLVLYSLFSLPWLLLSLVVLAGTSVLWGTIEKKSNGLCVVTLSHILADTGIAVAAISIGSALN